MMRVKRIKLHRGKELHITALYLHIGGIYNSMEIKFFNNSHKPVVVSVQGKQLKLGGQSIYTYNCECVDKNIDIEVMNCQKSQIKRGQRKYHIVVDLKAKCCMKEEKVEIVLKHNIKKFQNHTQYEYFTVFGENVNIYNNTYWVTNQREILEVYMNEKTDMKRQRKSMLGWALFDTIVDGGLLILILWWIFDYKVAIISFGSIYLLVLLANIIGRKLDKSKWRIFNWAKETEFEDDITYFINNIGKYCE